MKVASRASDYIRMGDKSGKIMTHVGFNKREILTVDQEGKNTANLKHYIFL